MVGLVYVCFKHDVVVLTLCPSTLLHGPYFCLICCWCFYCLYLILTTIVFNCACNLIEEHGLILFFEIIY